jgi:hypothetical protein
MRHSARNKNALNASPQRHTSLEIKANNEFILLSLSCPSYQTLALGTIIKHYFFETAFH